MATAAQKKSPLFMFLKARFEYLACIHKGPKEDLSEKLRQDVAGSILKQISFAKAVSVTDAIELTTLVNDSLLPETEADAIRNAIQCKADMAGDAAATSLAVGRQTHLNLEHYQSTADWDCYSSSDVGHDVKLANMASRMTSLHLRSPTEPTYANAVAIALHLDGPHEPSYLLSKVRRMKEFVASLVKNTPKSEAPSVYPETIDEFKVSYTVIFAAAFASDLPAPCQIPPAILQVLKGSTPCRKTRTGCAEALVQHPPKHSHSIVQQAFQRRLSLNDPYLPGFQWSNQRQPQQQSPLALCMGPWLSQGGVQGQLNQDVPLPKAAPTAVLALGDVEPVHTSAVPAAPLAAAAPPATSAGSSVIPAPPSSISELVSKWQKQAAAAKAAKDDKGDEDEVGEEPGTRMKRPAAAISGKPQKAKAKGKPKQRVKARGNRKQKPKAAGKPRQKAKAKNIAKPNSALLLGKPEQKTKAKSIAKPNSDLVFDRLSYKAGHMPPRYYGCVTIYSDLGRKTWRVKPRPGERIDVKFMWRPEPKDNREQWETLVKHVKSLKQV